MARIFALLLMLLPSLAQAVERALIVGNDIYGERLKAEEDAGGYTELFTRKGFEVTTILNAPMGQMRRQLAEFYETIQPGDTVAFIYSQARAATARGLAQFSYIVDISGDPLITSETSVVLERYKRFLTIG